MDKLIFGLVVAILVGTIWFVVDRDNKERVEWAKFSIARNCKKVGHMSGSTSTGYGVASDGKMGLITTSTPSKDGFACNDGVTYWR